MQLKKSLREKVLISKEYKIFSLCATLAICFAYGLFCFIAYQNHKTTYDQKHLSVSYSIANGYEVFLDNIFRQAEFIGHKIEATSNRNRSLTIRHLLKRNFSMGIDLDTTLLSSWVEFKWMANAASESEVEKKYPWRINFHPLRMDSPNSKDSYIPISFGVTNREGNFVGKLVSNINMFELTKYLGRILSDEQIHILILDKEKNIIAQSAKPIPSVPRDFFKNYNFENEAGTFAKKYEFNKITYSTYKKLKSYPFAIIVGENKNAILKPLFTTLIHYFAVLIIVLAAFLMILSKFYRKIINPIISLSDFAKRILESDDKIEHIPEKHSFVEIKNLSEALRKISDYQTEICHSNKKLNQKTQELERIKQNLEENLQKLSNSYALIDQFNNSVEEKEIISVNQCINNCLLMLYPEIYSRQLKIEESLEDGVEPELGMSCNKLTKIISTLLSRSFMFSKKSSSIQIKTGNTILEDKNYFCLTIEDAGVGDENWRIKNSDNKKMDEIQILVKDNDGILHCINKDDGVKYCLLLLQKKELQNGAAANNVHYLFPANNTN
jgi:hypothetical protein